jgi:hypothetical protein
LHAYNNLRNIIHLQVACIHEFKELKFGIHVNFQCQPCNSFNSCLQMGEIILVSNPLLPIENKNIQSTLINFFLST